MTKAKEIGDAEYKKILKDVMGVPISIESWFPLEVSDWISYHSTLLGVAETYIAFPLCTAVAYCAQHATVKLADEMHDEPVLLYSLVAGRSGTNKSASLNKILNMILNIENPKGNHDFDTGTLEGLMKGMSNNNQCIFSTNDEFATFYEAMEKNGGSLDKSRFLSLYSCTRWAKQTKSNGECTMDDPRFNFVSFTQPRYAVNFAQNNVSDGFFQRFLISIPQEKFIKRKEKKDMKQSFSFKNRLDMQKILNRLFKLSGERQIVMVLDAEAESLYDNHHDSATTYREENQYEESRVSVMSKSIGLTMRLSGVICLMRNTILIDDEEEKKLMETKDEELIQFIVSKEDFQMAINIVQYSVKTSFALVNENNMQRKGTAAAASRSSKLPVPEPENFTMDYAVENSKIVRKYLSASSIPMSMVSRDKMYPIVNNHQGQAVGKKFVEGLKNIGLGYISPSSKSFKRFHPDDENCPDRDNLRRKYRLLNLDSSSGQSNATGPTTGVLEELVNSSE